MKNKLKKGFTIVELVIVIAVIAILAAVLIPTFSSITNSARESAALQEAKSGSETILALTTGTLPENSAFLVADDEESDTNDYTFVFAGQKIQNVNAVEEFSDVLNMCKRNDVMTSGSATEGYIVYVSIDALKLDDKGQVTDTVAGGADGEAEQATLDAHVANRILSAIGVTETVTDGENNKYTIPSSDYAMWNFEKGDKTYYFNIYWTSDFNPTLIAFMGGNVAGESADDEPGDAVARVKLADSLSLPDGIIKVTAGASGTALTTEAQDITVTEDGIEFGFLMSGGLTDTALTITYTIGGAEQTAETTGGKFTIAKSAITGEIVITNIVSAS